MHLVSKIERGENGKKGISWNKIQQDLQKNTKPVTVSDKQAIQSLSQAL